MLNGTAAKFIVAVLGAVGTGLTTYYGSQHWVPVVLAGISALGVYLVPNKTPTNTPASGKATL